MQAALNHSSALESFRFASGRSYMMRSEKRPDPAGRTGNSDKRPPRRRRKRAGFFYKFFMTLLLLTLWPVGLLMLWQRKLRWGIPTKLLTSIVTLAACIILIGFALTVNTGNAQYTAVQDQVNSFLDTAADALIETGGIVSQRSAEMLDDMENVADALWDKGKLYLSNGIDAGISFTQHAKNSVLTLVEKLQSTPEPSAEALPSVEATQSPTQSAQTGASTTPTVKPSATAETIAQTNTMEATAVPTAETETTRNATVTPTAETEPTPEASATPTAEPFAPSATLKPAGEAIVYHSMDGKWYHSFNRCSGMTGGGAYTLEECAQTHKQCKACGAPSADLIGKVCLWMDADQLCHTSDECSAFNGKYTLILRDDAIEQTLLGCEACGGDEYLLPNAIIENEKTDIVQNSAQ